MPSANGKLARFLLDLLVGHAEENGHPRARLTLTHEDIGEMIGALRETATRQLANSSPRTSLRCVAVAL